MTCLHRPNVTYQLSLEKAVMSLMPGASDPILTGTLSRCKSALLKNVIDVINQIKNPFCIKKTIKTLIKTSTKRKQELKLQRNKLTNLVLWLRSACFYNRAKSLRSKTTSPINMFLNASGDTKPDVKNWLFNLKYLRRTVIS